jgi:hypothetical protein
MVEWQDEGFDVMLNEVRKLGPIVLSGMVLSVPIGILAIIAGMRMLECQSRGLIVTASILTMLPLTPVLFGFPIGIWALIMLNRTEVRAAFAQVAKRRSSSTTDGDLTPSTSPSPLPPMPRDAYAPGVAPRMLLLTLGFIASMLSVAVGLGLLAFAAMSYAPSEDGRWGYLGGGYGLLFGGVVGILGCWNRLRTMRGKLDWMHESNWNLYDTLLLAYGLAGVACLALAGTWTSIEVWARYAALVIGGVAAMQGIGMSVWRVGMRRAATRTPGRPALGLQMILVAVGITACGLLVAGGVALLIYSFTSLPAGSVKFWAGVGSALGWLLGGSGGLIATWNAYRSLEGLPNWMTEGQPNVLDVWTIASLGGLFMIAGLVAAPWVTMTSVYALELIGGILVLTASLFHGIRALMRRAARQEANHRLDA